MEDVKWLFRKYGLLLALILVILVAACIVLEKRTSVEEVWEPSAEILDNTHDDSGNSDEEMDKDIWAKGYDLPINEID